MTTPLPSGVVLTQSAIRPHERQTDRLRDLAPSEPHSRTTRRSAASSSGRSSGVRSSALPDQREELLVGPFWVAGVADVGYDEAAYGPIELEPRFRAYECDRG